MQRRGEQSRLPLAVAGAIGGTALAWAVAHYGATETWELYRLFLGLVASALLVAWTLPIDSWWSQRLPALLVVGGYLLAQTAWQPSLETRGYTLASIGWLALFISLGLATQGRNAARGILVFFLLLGCAEALFGLTQMLAPDDPTSYRFRVHGITGSFFNHNHFAGLLNMSLALAVGALFASFGQRGHGRSRRSEAYARTWLILLPTAFMGLAVLLSLSRGGTLSLFSTLVFLALLLAWARRRSSARGLSARAVLLLCLIILGLGLAVGLGGLRQNFEEISASSQNRLQIYADSLRLIGDHAVLGVGPGMYRWHFRPYQTTGLDHRYDHAHNDFLEIAADWGVPAALLFWSFVAWRLYRACRRFLIAEAHWQQGMALGCAGAIFSILFHSLGDFNLQIPANLAIFCSILGLAWSLERPLGTPPIGPTSGVRRSPS
ncbi:MAG: O-antigen ligase family protein [Acidobacteriota bacterium]